MFTCKEFVRIKACNLWKWYWISMSHVRIIQPRQKEDVSIYTDRKGVETRGRERRQRGRGRETHREAGNQCKDMNSEKGKSGNTDGENVKEHSGKRGEARVNRKTINKQKRGQKRCEREKKRSPHFCLHTNGIMLRNILRPSQENSGRVNQITENPLLPQAEGEEVNSASKVTQHKPWV